MTERKSLLYNHCSQILIKNPGQQFSIAKLRLDLIALENIITTSYEVSRTINKLLDNRIAKRIQNAAYLVVTLADF